MSARHLRWGWTVLVAGTWWLQPISCLIALNLEPRLSDTEGGGSVDPHGLGALAAMVAGAVLFVPVTWLLTGFASRPAPSGRLHHVQSAVALAVIGSPGLMQIMYMRLGTIDWVWPIVVAATLWFALAATLTLHRGGTMPSPHARFTTWPRTAWTIVSVIAILSAAFLGIALG